MEINKRWAKVERNYLTVFMRQSLIRRLIWLVNADRHLHI